MFLLKTIQGAALLLPAEHRRGGIWENRCKNLALRNLRDKLVNECYFLLLFKNSPDTLVKGVGAAYCLWSTAKAN